MTDSIIDVRALSISDYATAKANQVSAARRGKTPETQPAPVVAAGVAAPNGDVGTTLRAPPPVIKAMHVSDMTPAEYAAHKKAAIKHR